MFETFKMFEMFERAPVPERSRREIFDPSTLRLRSGTGPFRLPVILVILVIPVIPFFLLQSFRFANDPEADAFDVGIPPDTLGLLGICL